MQLVLSVGFYMKSKIKNICANCQKEFEGNGTLFGGKRYCNNCGQRILGEFTISITNNNSMRPRKWYQ